MAATAEYDPFATGYQAAYDRNMAMNNTAPVSAVSISSVPSQPGSTKTDVEEITDYLSNYNTMNAMVEAEEALGGGGYYDEVYGSNNDMAFSDEGGDNPMVAKVVPEPVLPPVVDPRPTFLSTYRPYVPTLGPRDQIRPLGLLAPTALYGSPTQRGLVANYISNYPTLDQAFIRQLG